MPRPIVSVRATRDERSLVTGDRSRTAELCSSCGIPPSGGHFCASCGASLAAPISSAVSADESSTYVRVDAPTPRSARWRPFRRARALSVLGGLALVAGLVWAPFVSATPSPIRYVGPGTGSGGGSCSAPDYATIQPAVTAAATDDTIQTIHICAGTYSLGATIAVSKVLKFVGDGAASTIIDGTTGIGANVQLFRVSATDGTFSGLTLQNGNAPGSSTYGYGGAIYASGGVTVSNSTFSGNRAVRSAGAIFAFGAVIITGSTFSSNTANGPGGAIYTGSTIDVTNSAFSGNTSEAFDAVGGAIFGLSTISVTNSTFSGNKAVSSSGYSGEGGAIDSAGSVDVTTSTFSDNQADDRGGAIHASDVTVSNSTFSGNIANAYGGAVSSSSTLDISNSTFSDNIAHNNGGAIHASGGSVTVTNSTFSGNSAYLRGGAIEAGSVTVTNSTFSGNTARRPRRGDLCLRQCDRHEQHVQRQRCR